MSAHPLQLAVLFTDHAVLQRNIPVPVWGWMKPKARVRVTLGAFSAQSLSGADGKFLVRLPAMPAGGPYELVVESPEDGQKKVVRDVWVGEVWVASGQSNMEWTLTQIDKDGDPALPCAGVRMLYIPHTAYAGRQSTAEAQWAVGDTRDALAAFSAVGYYFARRLHDELGIKVGILNTSWGGTIVEAWTSRESLVRNPATAPWLAEYESGTHDPAFWADFADRDLSNPASRQAPPKLENGKPVYPADESNEGFGKGWANPDFNDSSWDTMRLPSTWTGRGHKYSGVFWFRKTIEIPAEWAGKDLVLNIGAVDKQDVTYFNGEQIGGMGQWFEDLYWNKPREYTVPGRLVKAGKAVIAVRAYSFVYDGGMIGPGTRMKVGPEGAENPISLPGDWRYEVEKNFGLVAPASGGMLPPGPGAPNSPGILFDNMIAPLLPYAIRGAIWYQGESNASDGFAVNYDRYQEAIRTLMRDWRFYWGQGDFPFLQVQLANFRASESYQEESEWARLRESQRLSLAEPEAGMAVIIDAGEDGNIHPQDKAVVGSRLAQWALAKTYGRNIVPSGPLYRKMQIEGSTIRLSFDHVGGGLVARGGALKTFYIADSAKKFYEAQAVIEEDTVVVSCPKVTRPLSVRYAWADNPEGCNLYNAEGLPASPFRTDSW